MALALQLMLVRVRVHLRTGFGAASNLKVGSLDVPSGLRFIQ